MRISPFILLSFTSLFWSLNFIIGKLVVGVIPPITISFFRWGIPLSLYLLYAWKDIRANQQVYKDHWILILGLGATGYSFNSIAVYEAVLYTSTINTSFINAFNPVLIALTGFILYRYPVTVNQVSGFIISLAGVTWIIFKGNPALILKLRINIGDLMMVGSIVSWSIHTILYKRYASLFPRESLFTMMMLGGVVVTIPLMVVENIIIGSSWVTQVSPPHIVGILCLNIFPSVLAYRFWNQALDKVPANKVAIFQYLIPVYTVIISLLFLGERLQPFQILGGTLIFIGVLLVTNKTLEK
jgi:drug/metabolite transporter (DMT)-like permease